MNRRLSRHASRHASRGAALLLAMLILTLVATLAASALWRQWRQVEVESAERTRQQIVWLLVGAQDWARLILREDARTNQIDHLAEPWAIPLQEAKLSSFLSMDKQFRTDEVVDAMLSGQITDLQARLNVRNLQETGTETYDKAFARLFRTLGLPTAELDQMTQQLRLSAQNTDQARLPVRRVEDLVPYGLSPGTLARLAPYITWLPAVTAINLNTASAEVLSAAIGGLDIAQARRLVQQRNLGYFRSLSDAKKLLPSDAQTLDDNLFAVQTHYFEVIGRLRIGTLLVEEHALMERQNTTVTTLMRWRTTPAPDPQTVP